MVNFARAVAYSACCLWFPLVAWLFAHIISITLPSQMKQRSRQASFCHSLTSLVQFASVSVATLLCGWLVGLAHNLPLTACNDMLEIALGLLVIPGPQSSPQPPCEVFRFCIFQMEVKLIRLWKRWNWSGFGKAENSVNNSKAWNIGQLCEIQLQKNYWYDLSFFRLVLYLAVL